LKQVLDRLLKTVTHRIGCCSLNPGAPRAGLILELSSDSSSDDESAERNALAPLWPAAEEPGAALPSLHFRAKASYGPDVAGRSGQASLARRLLGPLHPIHQLMWLQAPFPQPFVYSLVILSFILFFHLFYHSLRPAPPPPLPPPLSPRCSHPRAARTAHHDPSSAVVAERVCLAPRSTPRRARPTAGPTARPEFPRTETSRSSARGTPCPSRAAPAPSSPPLVSSGWRPAPPLPPVLTGRVSSLLPY